MPEKKILTSNPKAESGNPLSAPSFSSDSEAWNAFREGSESAFIFIYETYFDILFGYGYSIIPDTHVVKDALQDLFVELRERRAHLGATDSIKFYLFTCLKRRLFRDLTKWEGNRESIEALPGDFLFTLSHESQLIDRQLSADKIDQLNGAISHLSQRQREIIYYSFFEGFTYRQIREIMGMESAQSVRNLMHKAIRELRKLL
ncbi:RNA polymerase ECF-type sigma factor [Lunatimonas lonarensis]|uniref:RNA polymerase ECF-type sigma factor n=1 Tax=Lunatimonas lonarensis TaxID=1232681 RepID=R7ZKR5_9BACT|nr:sigma-70 family RNA polymerase sigma factor [Lunatimonas lonarensis]EON74691.1 RNA polymerase ECF-type sigma factor [Lunatimonas lonarensis]